jgi:hypothetical protein
MLRTRWAEGSLPANAVFDTMKTENDNQPGPDFVPQDNLRRRSKVLRKPVRRAAGGDHPKIP